MRIVGIIVARNGSTRVPGKSMIRCMDQAMIEQLIKFLNHTGKPDDLWASTHKCCNFCPHYFTPRLNSTNSGS